jgi:glycosyltransferase involved in cell wall biosynthesis
MGKADICVITTIHPPYEGRIYERGVKAFAQAGLSVALVSGWPAPSHDPYVRSWITVTGSKTRTRRIANGLRTFRATLRQKASVYYFHDIDFIVWAVLLALVTRRPVIFDCHENYALEVRYNKPWIPRLLRLPLATATSLVEAACVRVLRYCVVPVEGMDERFRRLGAETVVVRNLADWQARRDVPHARGVVYSGTIAANFGAHVIVGIARELKQRGIYLPVILTLRNASDDMQRLVRNAIKLERLDIRLVPRVLPAQIDKLLGQGCIGISVYLDSPEKRAAMPAKLFEYMAMGMPIVASDLPLKRKIVTESGTGVLVKPNTPAAFVDAILAVLDDPPAFERFRENGFRAVETLYAWRLEKEILTRFVKRVIARSERHEDAAA